jgi:DNA helicase TIP49 (TBP-interacting protein)
MTWHLFRRRLAQWVANEDELVLSQYQLDALLEVRAEMSALYAVHLLTQAERVVPALVRSKPETRH